MFAYLDESGDTGFQFRQGGSSRYFTLAFLLVDDPLPLHQAVHDLRLQLRLAETHEFKFGTTGHEYRNAFFLAIRPHAFAVRAMVIDKQDPTIARLRGQTGMYDHLVGMILAREREALQDRTLVIDESVQGKGAQARLGSALRRMIAAEEKRSVPVVRRIVFHRSYQDNLLQVADMAVGAVARAHGRGDARYLRLLGRKLKVGRYP